MKHIVKSGCLNRKPLLTKPRERSWKPLEKAKLSESKNKHWCIPPGFPVVHFKDGATPCRWHVHPQARHQVHQEIHVFMMEGDPKCMALTLSSPLQYTANYLDSHRGRGQLVINYPEIPEAGKGWRGWGRHAPCCISSALLHWENSKTSFTQATVKCQDILVVGSIIICFGDIWTSLFSVGQGRRKCLNL